MGDESQVKPPTNGGQEGGASSASQGDGASSFGFKSEEEFNTVLNRAITKRLKDFGAKLTEDLGKALDEKVGGVSKALEEKLSGLGTSTDKGKGKDKSEQQAPAEQSPEMKQALAEIAALKKTNEENARVASEMKTRARAVARAEQVAKALAAAKVPSDWHDIAVTYLVSKGLVDYEDQDSDEIVYRKSADEAVPLDKGLAAWLKTDSGKRFLPPQNPKAPGGGPGFKPGSGGRESAESILAGELDSLFGNGST